MNRAAVPVLLLLAAGCARVDVTPGSVREAAVPEDERETALARWTEAVEMANAFLASPYRKTLPPGRIELRDDGMRFVTDAGWWPLGIRCTTWGGVVLGTGGRAQATTRGFLTGRRGPDGRDLDRAVDNSFFRLQDGSLDGAEGLATLFIHELAHIVYRDGTIGFGPSVAYILEMVFLLRSASHSAEDRPRAASEEFTWYRMATDPAQAAYHAAAALGFEQHLASESSMCRHGPFEEYPEPPRK